MKIDHVAGAASGSERVLADRGRPRVVLEHCPNTKAVFDHTNERKLLEARHPVGTLSNAPISVDWPTESDTDSLNDHIVGLAANQDRLDQPANRVNRAGRGRIVTDRVGGVDNPPFSAGQDNALPAAADFDADC
jgi:hypothetical protein